MINKIEQKIQDCPAQGSPGKNLAAIVILFLPHRNKTQKTLSCAVYALDHSKLN